MKAPPEVILTLSNIDQFPTFKSLLDEGKIVADKTGRLRYPHGAPVGRLIYTRTSKDGVAIYKECADEWFDPASQAAREFEWPK